jgi:hypothetical protein
MPKDAHPLGHKQVLQHPAPSLAAWSLAHGLWRYTRDELTAINAAAPRLLTREEIDELEGLAWAYCQKLPILTKEQADSVSELAMDLAAKLNSLSWRFPRSSAGFNSFVN